MKSQICGKLPFPAECAVNFKNKTATFKYLDVKNVKEVITELYFNWLMLEIYALASILLVYIIISSLNDLVTYGVDTNTLDVSANQLVSAGLFIMFFLIPLVLSLIHLYSPFGKLLKYVLPKFYQYKYGTKRAWKRYTTINKDRIIIPIFDKMVIEWAATEDFEKYLSKVEIKSFDYIVDHSEDGCYFTIFTFSKIPIKGDILIQWW